MLYYNYTRGLLIMNKISFTTMFFDNKWQNGILINYLDAYVLGKWNGTSWENCKSVNLQTQTIIEDNLKIRPIYTKTVEDFKLISNLEIIKLI